MNRRLKKILSLIAAAMMSALALHAQEPTDTVSKANDGVTYLDPLFEYPIAPEDISDFSGKCDWLAENFWNKFDTKTKNAVDQAKINHAFSTYATTCQYASKDKVSNAIDRIMKNLQKNPTLLVQFVKAAEESIYGSRAEVYIDELYVKILKNALSNKKFPKNRRARYESQLKQLEGSLVGGSPAVFDFTRPNGDAARFFPMGTPTILIFGNPGEVDSRINRIRMEAKVAFREAVDGGKINVLYIIPDKEEGWESKFDGFPKNWTTGASDSINSLYDLRATPEVYVIGKEGKIVAKHQNALSAVEIALSLINSEK